MWNPDEFLEHAYREAVGQKETERSTRSWAERREGIRQALLDALGKLPDHDVPLEPELIWEGEVGGCRLERVLYTTTDRMRVPAYVVVPPGLTGRAPAVVAWHGHGVGSRDFVGLRADDTPDEERISLRRPVALALADRGLIVIVPEIAGFGDRRLTVDSAKDPKATSSCFALASRLLMCGKTLAGLRVYEARRTVDYAAGRGDIDPQRIGCMGFSGGGLVAAFSAALDERLQVSLLCGFTSTFRGSLWHRTHCIDNYLPGILLEAELPELIGLTAPRALFVESGEQDGLFPAPSFTEAVDTLTGIYGECGNPAAFDHDLFPGKHEISGRRSFDWVAARLRHNSPIE